MRDCFYVRDSTGAIRVPHRGPEVLIESAPAGAALARRLFLFAFGCLDAELVFKLQ